MTPRANHKRLEAEGQTLIGEYLQERLRLAIKFTLIQILEQEVEAFVNAAPYQRTPERRDYRNGSYERDLGTSMGVIEDLPVPRTGNGFQTELFERYHRRQAELDEAICQMFVRGVSTAHVGDVVEALTGASLSPSAVSRVFHSLEGEFEGWKQRQLKPHYLYLFADGPYFSVIYAAEGCKMPILAIVGIDAEGRREVLAFTVGERENQRAWEDLLEELKNRGVETVDLWITDGHKAMLNAIAINFPTSKRQRCGQHKMENVLGYLPEKQHDEVRPELRAIFYHESREKADQELAAFVAKYEQIYPTAVACLKRDLEACLTFYRFPIKHWKFIRTTNIIERLFNEVKKPSHKMAAAFRNENSCLLMFYAVIRSLKLRRISVPAKDAEAQNLHNS
ncbi:MAG: IS256 family transposase [Ardenticatenaceae bacterium]|nr:IS256 family transposase [Ardenticatenaceae bacterium]